MLCTLHYIMFVIHNVLEFHSILFKSGNVAHTNIWVWTLERCRISPPRFLTECRSVMLGCWHLLYYCMK